MTVTELGLATRLGKAAISHLEAGDYGASLPVIRDVLAPALRCEPEELYLPHVLALIDGSGEAPAQTAAPVQEEPARKVA